MSDTTIDEIRISRAANGFILRSGYDHEYRCASKDDVIVAETLSSLLVSVRRVLAEPKPTKRAKS